MTEMHDVDPISVNLLRKEEQRQFDKIRLIPSENYCSKAVSQMVGSVFANKYSEGYPYKRYYEGQEYADQIETLAIERAKTLFNVQHANVQPLSGVIANLATYFSILKTNDKILSLSLPYGGHLSHGWPVNISGQLFDVSFYKVDPVTHLLDYDAIMKIAKEVHPKLIICGTSAYTRTVDFKAFREIADKVNAILLADIAHISGLVVAGVHPSPSEYAHIITTTTHKSLRGPRGGLILSQEQFSKQIDKLVFPGLQGGPHLNNIAAKAVAFKEASSPEFANYANQIVLNAKKLASHLMDFGFKLITDGTDNHLILIDVTKNNTTGRLMAKALNRAGIVCNQNTIPFDTRTPFDPSGIRIGTPAITSRGMKESEMKFIATKCYEVSLNIQNEAKLDLIASEVREFCQPFTPIGLEHLAKS